MGDVLVLTKPLGIGVITTGIKQGVAVAESVVAALASMRTLNRAARDAVATIGPHACTDVTGYSLLGHLYQTVRASASQPESTLTGCRWLPGALDLARQGVGPGGTQRNRAYFGPHVTLAEDIEPALADLLFDPQTSGGLLVSVAGDKSEALLLALTASGALAVAIGEVTETSAGHVHVIE